MPQNMDEEYLDYLADAFCTEAKKENDKLAILGFVAGVTVWGLSGNIIAGLALGGCVLLYSDRSMRASNRALYAIEKTQIAAPFLSADSFRDFQRKYGNAFCLEQLKQAHEYGLPMQPEAEAFLYKHCPELEAQESARAAEAIPTLELVDAPTISTTDHPDSLPVVDLAERMGQALKPTIISAMPRAGKGVLLANAWRAAKRHHPDLRVYVIDPKAHPDEAGYWQGCDRVLSIRFDQISVNCPDTVAVVEAFIDEWRNDPAAKKLLIFDEQVLVEAKLPKWYREYVPALAKSEGSSGETYHRYLWLVMQSPQCKDIGLSGGSRSIFVFCALATNRATEGLNPQAWMTSAKASGFIPSIPTNAQFETSPRGTLCCSSLLDGWVALPEYPVPEPQSVAQPVQTIAEPEDSWSKTRQELDKQIKAIVERFNQGELDRKFIPDLRVQLEQMKRLVSDRREDLLRIALLSIEKGCIKARHVAQFCGRKECFKQLKKTSGNNFSDAVRALFIQLQEMGIGEVVGEADQLGYRIFKTDEREADKAPL